MNVKLLITILVFSFAVLSASAQKAIINVFYRNINADIIVDSRDLPPNAITPIARPLTTNGTNSIWGTNTVDNLGSALNNEKVYYYFAVSKVENATSNNWSAAINTCRNYNSGDGTNKWRLPTQRELMLMWVLKNQLEEKILAGGGAAFFGMSHHSATEDGTTNWYVTFVDGSTATTSSKTNNTRARCVRDLVP